VDAIASHANATASLTPTAPTYIQLVIFLSCDSLIKAKSPKNAQQPSLTKIHM